MANKFHIDPKRVYEIWDNKECLQQGIILSSSNRTKQTLEAVSEVSSISLLATKIPKKHGRKKKVKIDEKPVTEAS
ncbi:7407_t:CDS:1, partial [Funneliformis geosporum]